MSSKNHPVLQECGFFIGRLCRHTRQCCNKRRAFFDNAHTFKLIELLRGMLYVKNTAYCEHMSFCKMGTAPLKGDMWECTLHCFKGHGVSSKGMLHIL